VPGLSDFSVHVQPHDHPGPPNLMDSEILIRPLSLWQEYSTEGLLFLLETDIQNKAAPNNSGWPCVIYNGRTKTKHCSNR